MEWICGICGTPLIWGADFDYDDYGFIEEGVVGTYTCPKCGAYVEVYMTNESNKKRAGD